MLIITWLGGKTFKKQKWHGGYYILTVDLERLNCEGFATMVFAMCLLSVTLSKYLQALAFACCLKLDEKSNRFYYFKY